MARSIDFYFDFTSAYGYLAACRIDDLGWRYGRNVLWHPFLLGVSVVKVMGLKPVMETPLKADYARVDVPRMARIMNIPLTMPETGQPNPLAAARAFYWMDEQDPALARKLALALLAKQWGRGEDISAAETVAGEAAALGIDRRALTDAIATPQIKERLARETGAAIKRGVFGSPFFIIDDQSIWGVDRLWMVEKWLRNGSWDGADTL